MNISDVLEELDDHGFEDTGGERKMAHINATYFDVLYRHPWPWLQGWTQPVVTAGSDAWTPVANVHRVLAVTNVTDKRLMRQITTQELFRRYGHNLGQTGKPRLWALAGTTVGNPLSRVRIFVYPIPTVDTTLNVNYVAQASPLAEGSVEADIYLPATFHRLLVTGALVRLYSMEDDPELASQFKQEYEEQVANLAAQYLTDPSDSPGPEGGQSERTGSPEQPQ